MGYYLPKANASFKQIKHYFDYGGVNGHSQASSYFHNLGDYYSKSAGKPKHAVDHRTIQQMYFEAKELMEIMKRREDGLPDTEPFNGFDVVYKVLRKNGFDSVEFNPVINDLKKVGIIFSDGEAFGDVNEILAVIEHAKDGDIESLKAECKNQGLLDK